MGRKSKKYQKVIQHLVARFLKPDLEFKAENFESIGEILDLPIHVLKGISREEGANYEAVFEISTIKAIAELDLENPLSKILPEKNEEETLAEYEARVKPRVKKAQETLGDLQKLRNTIMIAKMIERAWHKRSSYLDKKETKVICIGLDNAGKSAILSSLGGKMGLDELEALKPTKKVDRKTIETDTLELFVWDFGGQKQYRDIYLEKPETYFFNTDLVLYVLDMQDDDRFQESFDYFEQICSVLQRLSERAYVLIFLHKSDPDIIDDPEFQVNLEYAKNHLIEMMDHQPFEYDIYVTSIFNFFNSEPSFSKHIKGVLKNEISLTNPFLNKIEGLGEIMRSTLESITKLADSVGGQIAEMDYRIKSVEKAMDEIAGAIGLVRKKPSNQPAGEKGESFHPTIQNIANSALASQNDLNFYERQYEMQEKEKQASAIYSSGGSVPRLSPLKGAGIQKTEKKEITEENFLDTPLEEIYDKDRKKSEARIEILKQLHGMLRKKN